MPGVGGHSVGERPKSRGSVGYEEDRGGELPGKHSDGRMPALFVGSGGVYDAAEHYKFERGEPVHDMPVKVKRRDACRVELARSYACHG